MFSHLLSISSFSIERQQRGEKKNLNGVLWFPSHKPPWEREREREQITDAGLQDRHQTISPNQIISKRKENYIKYWNETTESQSKLELYLTLNREYMVAEYLTTVTDRKLRKMLTMYTLSGHNLAIETGRHRLPGEIRCSLCHDYINC